ncbi:hypothetical protein ER308_08950 [Egibacter rhizosphaerae]|uniref:Uncharacterized protein n=1 Tax=Egibacter rhizosphaerae TaxID=1670831 RepID=A0A411YEH7_9ACTN|nr:hypothetical protein [Egibacter rhizosphaerae]QBI19664.1 hypothetical protein ER308_08950 [Egibacter rhizosphaerae]
MTEPSPAPHELRDLADEPSPETVGLALRRFRRRVIFWTLLVGGIGGLGILVVTAPDDQHLTDRYDALDTHTPIGAVESTEGSSIALLDAARLSDDRYAVRAVAWLDEAEAHEGRVWARSPSFPGDGDGEVTEITSRRQGDGVTELFFTLPLGEHHAIVELHEHDATGETDEQPLAEFDLDLRGYDLGEVTEP